MNRSEQLREALSERAHLRLVDGFAFVADALCHAADHDLNIERWGYDDSSYALQSGTQVSIGYKMVERVMGRRR